MYGDTQLSATPTIISDERLKTDIRMLTDSLNKVGKLRGVYYSWLPEELTGVAMPDTKRHVGVIAQDVFAVLPEAIEMIYDDKYMGVKYTGLIPLLVEAVRELDLRTTRSELDLRTTRSALRSVNNTSRKMAHTTTADRDISTSDHSRLLAANDTVVESIELRDLHSTVEALRAKDKVLIAKNAALIQRVLALEQLVEKLQIPEKCTEVCDRFRNIAGAVFAAA